MMWREMKWICVYCKKVMDSTNFIDFITESDSKDTEIHGWRLMPEEGHSSTSAVATAAIQL